MVEACCGVAGWRRAISLDMIQHRAVVGGGTRQHPAGTAWMLGQRRALAATWVTAELGTLTHIAHDGSARGSPKAGWGGWLATVRRTMCRQIRQCERLLHFGAWKVLLGVKGAHCFHVLLFRRVRLQVPIVEPLLTDRCAASPTGPGPRAGARAKCTLKPKLDALRSSIAQKTLMNGS